MVDLVSQAAEKAVPAAPLLELGGDGWPGAQVVTAGPFDVNDI
jgi:hypothetical protein